MSWNRRTTAALVFGIHVSSSIASAQPVVQIGTKKFTESRILGDIAAHLMRHAGFEVDVRTLGGTEALFEALRFGDIDLYPEYTGTITEQILRGQNVRSDAEIRKALAAYGIAMSGRIGFNNTYVLGMRADTAERLGIVKLSELRDHADLAFGFSNEFMARGDGWPSLQRAYALPQSNVKGMDHTVAYEALQSGVIDAMDLYSTDAEIQQYDLRALEDDRNHFPPYYAVYLYRTEASTALPAVAAALKRLDGAISETQMVAMNVRVKHDRVPAPVVAADFLTNQLGLTTTAREQTVVGRITRHTLEHLFLVGVSLAAAMAIGIPLGIAASRWAGFGQVVLTGAGLVQTIPSLALLVFMIPLLGVGAKPAIMALFLYSLLPIVRNTYAGLHGISPSIRESAEALGLPGWARLIQVELPMASRTILAGVKTSAVINVGFATLGAFIGAGGYGELILTGMELRNTGLILQGAVPAAMMALCVQGLFDLAEARLVPKGLRLHRPGVT